MDISEGTLGMKNGTTNYKTYPNLETILFLTIVTTSQAATDDNKAYYTHTLKIGSEIRGGGFERGVPSFSFLLTNSGGGL